MVIIRETEARTTTTPGGTMAALAGPSQGSEEISTWRVHMPAEARSPIHSIDRDQVWMPLAGTFEITVAEEPFTVSAGEAAVVPAGAERVVAAAKDAEALVCMRPDGTVSRPGVPGTTPVPWAQ
ncbi:cupin domain-containing protein [Spiractinospora alimapuensis]|uniref:cupin domain-containing protein n=1 Tax=Spiractinospora alimapuensis TaxID=2820884 RepID=UPI001F184C16|nr:cupin domain-containing protein [Spiractinospora alimapuensis]QVQ54303.1 cupin domain-containing protein [Spiractinospora alimapuensis]